GLREQARFQGHPGLLRIGRSLIGRLLAARNDYRRRSSVLRKGRMVAGPGREPALVVFAVQAPSSADWDGPAEGPADAAASGERLRRDGLAPVGCALVAGRHLF